MGRRVRAEHRAVGRVDLVVVPAVERRRLARERVRAVEADRALDRGGRLGLDLLVCRPGGRVRDRLVRRGRAAPHRALVLAAQQVLVVRQERVAAHEQAVDGAHLHRRLRVTEVVLDAAVGFGDALALDALVALVRGARVLVRARDLGDAVPDVGPVVAAHLGGRAVEVVALLGAEVDHAVAALEDALVHVEIRAVGGALEVAVQAGQVDAGRAAQVGPVARLAILLDVVAAHRVRRRLGGRGVGVAGVHGGRRRVVRRGGARIDRGRGVGVRRRGGPVRERRALRRVGAAGGRLVAGGAGGRLVAGGRRRGAAGAAAVRTLRLAAAGVEEEGEGEGQGVQTLGVHRNRFRWLFESRTTLLRRAMRGVDARGILHFLSR